MAIQIILYALNIIAWPLAIWLINENYQLHQANKKLYKKLYEDFTDLEKFAEIIKIHRSANIENLRPEQQDDWYEFVRSEILNIKITNTNKQITNNK